jgi:hypothetical protein
VQALGALRLLGDAIRWMTDQRGLPFIDAVKELAQVAGLDMPEQDFSLWKGQQPLYSRPAFCSFTVLPISADRLVRVRCQNTPIPLQIIIAWTP